MKLVANCHSVKEPSSNSEALHEIISMCPSLFTQHFCVSTRLPSVDCLVCAVLNKFFSTLCADICAGYFCSAGRDVSLAAMPCTWRQSGRSAEEPLHIAL